LVRDRIIRRGVIGNETAEVNLLFLIDLADNLVSSEILTKVT
jgi:hypothetical protein